MPVLISTETGTRDEPNLYVIPACVDHGPYGSHAHEYPRRPDQPAMAGYRHENRDALLLSEWGNDTGVDITPQSDRPGVIDGEVVDA
jgi:hypothetical protein